MISEGIPGPAGWFRPDGWASTQNFPRSIEGVHQDRVRFRTTSGDTVRDSDPSRKEIHLGRKRQKNVTAVGERVHSSGP